VYALYSVHIVAPYWIVVRSSSPATVVASVVSVMVTNGEYALNKSVHVPSPLIMPGELPSLTGEQLPPLA